MKTNKQPTIECADMIAQCDGKFVVIERLSSMPGLAWPGGKQESGETLEAVIVREMYEETRLLPIIQQRVGRYDTPGRDPRGLYVSTVFCGLANGKPKDEQGKTRVLLLTKEEVLARKTEFVADHFRMFEDYLHLTA